MDFHIEREIFLKTLQRVQTVVERRNTIPILGNVLLAVADNVLTLSATDLDVSLRTQCVAEVEIPGTITLGARKLYDIVRELPAATLRLYREENNRVVLTGGPARFVLAGMPAEEFPTLPSPEGGTRVTVPSATLAEMFELTHFAMSQDESRYTLSGTLLQILPTADEEGMLLRMVATDTHRMALVETPLQETGLEAQELILPKKGVSEARKMLTEDDQPVDLVISATHLQVIKPEITLISKLVDARFPNYQRVIPQGNKRILMVDRQQLHGLVRRMSLLSNEKTLGIMIQLTPSSLRITSTNPEQEAAEEEMEASFEGEDPMEIGFNARYLLDIVAALKGATMRIGFQDDESPCLITDPEQDHFFYVLMPMRV